MVCRTLVIKDDSQHHFHFATLGKGICVVMVAAQFPVVVVDLYTGGHSFFF
jgi:hypothetical protein